MSHSSSVVVGISGARHNASVAVCVNGEVRAVCEQERITRVRRAGLVPGVMPTEALDVALRSAGRLTPADVTTYVTAEPAIQLPAGLPSLSLDHHEAHAATAFYLSPFEHAAVLICDHRASSQQSVWSGSPDRITNVPWAESAAGFAAMFTEAARMFGLSRGQEHELEGLARLDPGAGADRLNGVIEYRDGALRASPQWPGILADWLAESPGRTADPLRQRARVASAFQRHLGEQLVKLARDVGQRTGATRLCLGGGLFYNTYLTTAVQRSAGFDEVFVAPNPGNAGLAVGASLRVANDGARPATRVSPFLGPEFDAEETKRTLDNCKLLYEHLNERELIEVTVRALTGGQLVGWFQGRMEWGHRALGNRSILASPLSPFVLENLNVFLKHRQRHRAYGVSVPVRELSRFFEGPPASPHMEYEYAPRNPEQFRPVFPEGTQAIRVQTIPEEPAPGSSPRTRILHEQFGEATGVPVLVNTSFNGLLEPMVCSPRDAIRVFYGSGLDLLVLDRFVIRK